MTAPQPATPGSDSVRARLIAALPGAYPWGDVVDRELLPLVDRLRAEAKAEALEEAAESLPMQPSRGIEGLNQHRADQRHLRNRAAAYRINPSSEETHRGE